MADFPRLFANRYRVLEEVARGGQSVVYRAWDTQCERQVALKTGLDVDAFEAERRVAGLSNPALAVVHEAAVDTGERFVAMEWISKPTLAEWNQVHADERLESKAVAIVRAVACALEFLHNQPDPIFHLDLKPSNIFVDDGSDVGVKLADFGLSLAGTRCVGTPAYLAPERFRRNEPQCASDLYALGCVFYELLAGSPPFGHERMWSEFEVLHRETAAVRPLGITDAAWGVLSRLLAKDPGQRFVCAADLVVALDEARDASPWPKVEPSAVLGAGVVGGATLFGLSMVVGEATSYGHELNWSFNYLVVAPLATSFCVRALQRVDQLAVSAGPNVRNRQLRFRRSFVVLWWVTLSLALLFSVVGHAQRELEHVPSWGREPLLSVPASAAEGVFSTVYVVFIFAVLAQLPNLVGLLGAKGRIGWHVLRLRREIAAATSLLVFGTWLAWIQEGAATRGVRWVEMFVGRGDGNLWDWLVEVPAPSPYGGPLPVSGMLVSFLGALACSRCSVEGEGWSTRFRWPLLFVLGGVVFVLVRPGATWAVLALVASYLGLKERDVNL